MRMVDGEVTELPPFEIEQVQRRARALVERWRPAPADMELPLALRDVSFVPPEKKRPDPYVTPTEGAWAKPGPAAGPFRAELGDGSVVTYRWYRFCDQPALQHADLSLAERERMQKKVELLHRSWTKERAYLPTATTGKLASLDASVLVTPPKGLEVGFVPIVTRQELSRRQSYTAPSRPLTIRAALAPPARRRSAPRRPCSSARG
jgi:hypothetical protein